MNRIQYTIVFVLGGILAVCILTQIVLLRMSGYDDQRLRDGSQRLQTGEGNFQRLQQVATRIAQLSREKNDQGLRDLMDRHNIKIRNPNTSQTSTPTSTGGIPSTSDATNSALNPPVTK